MAREGRCGSVGGSSEPVSRCVLARWGGPAKDYPKADADGKGAVDGADLALVLGAWGACE